MSAPNVTNNAAMFEVQCGPMEQCQVARAAAITERLALAAGAYVDKTGARGLAEQRSIYSAYLQASAHIYAAGEIARALSPAPAVMRTVVGADGKTRSAISR